MSLTSEEPTINANIPPLPIFTIVLHSAQDTLSLEARQFLQNKGYQFEEIKSDPENTPTIVIKEINRTEIKSPPISYPTPAKVFLSALDAFLQKTEQTPPL